MLAQVLCLSIQTRLGPYTFCSSNSTLGICSFTDLLLCLCFTGGCGSASEKRLFKPVFLAILFHLDLRRIYGNLAQRKIEFKWRMLGFLYCILQTGKLHLKWVKKT